MSSYQFRFTDQDGDVRGDESYEFPDLMAAVAEAKRALGEMALDGLPHKSGDALTIEIINADGIAVARVGLTLSVDFPEA